MDLNFKLIEQFKKESDPKDIILLASDYQVFEFVLIDRNRIIVYSPHYATHFSFTECKIKNWSIYTKEGDKAYEKSI